jgi:DNA-binding Lrp family transcriptional regulator
MMASGRARVLAIINPRLLGIEMAWLAVAVRSPATRAGLAQQLAKLDAVTYVAICAGRFDLWVEVSFGSQEDLLRILDHEISSIGDVRRVEACVYLDVYYRGLRPAQL